MESIQITKLKELWAVYGSINKNQGGKYSTWNDK